MAKVKTWPQTYTHVQRNPHRVWFQCSCGWKTPKRKVGKPPKAVIFTPFLCPRCKKELSPSTVLR